MEAWWHMKRLEFSLSEIMEIIKESYSEAYEQTIEKMVSDDINLKAFVDAGHIDSYLKLYENIGKRFEQIYNQEG
jgi:hypothetical protein